jgi:hypothetical protein
MLRQPPSAGVSNQPAMVEDSAPLDDALDVRPVVAGAGDAGPALACVLLPHAVGEPVQQDVERDEVAQGPVGASPSGPGGAGSPRCLRARPSRQAALRPPWPRGARGAHPTGGAPARWVGVVAPGHQVVRCSSTNRS